ncbi:MAG: flagellar basal body rod protein FlgB [Melioribacteraceae bacterium]|nr:flagellar basal body rod protein FlgB [Ignavibacteriota bacterium]MBZ0182660.1 flagellar basal body rod protein FlgB [Melioribacteraceae bacterium]
MSASTSKLMEKVLDYTSLKNKVISKNIANSNTLNYKREDVEFNSLLNGESGKIKATNSKHIGFTENLDSSEMRIIKDETSVNHSGINNVDIDHEMAEMAQNSIMFKFASRKMSSYYKTLQSVIKGGR